MRAMLRRTRPSSSDGDRGFQREIWRVLHRSVVAVLKSVKIVISPSRIESLIWVFAGWPYKHLDVVVRTYVHGWTQIAIGLKKMECIAHVPYKGGQVLERVTHLPEILRVNLDVRERRPARCAGTRCIFGQNESPDDGIRGMPLLVVWRGDAALVAHAAARYRPRAGAMGMGDR